MHKCLPCSVIEDVLLLFTCETFKSNSCFIHQTSLWPLSSVEVLWNRAFHLHNIPKGVLQTGCGDGFQNTSKHQFCLKQRLWKSICSWKSLKHWREREIELITHRTDILQQLLLSCVNTSHKQNPLEEFCESRHFSFCVDWFKFRA